VVVVVDSAGAPVVEPAESDESSDEHPTIRTRIRTERARTRI
jgi:hypothetical protein